MDKEIQNKIVIYKDKSGNAQIDVKIGKDTVWLTQKQVAELFDIDRSVVAKHIKNVFDTNELNEKSNVQKMHIANSDKPVSFYNLDIIISVGYRVNFKRATQFRIWATGILKQHLLGGYTIYKDLLVRQEEKLASLKETISFIEQKADNYTSLSHMAYSI